jgi:cephalosporin hydroxylase
MKLFKIAELDHSGDPTTKPLSYYKRYEDFLLHHNIIPKNILEIGAYKGESTKVLSKAFPDSKIISLDIQLRDIDFSNHKNVTYLQADQSDPSQLAALVKKHFPDGVDLVIEDASHFGMFSKITFDAVFPFVKSGGAYFVEDWGTGYWDSWIDGSRYQEFPLSVHSGNIPKRIPSHDFGMVGFVKSLVDLTHESAIKNNQKEDSKYITRIEVLEFGEGVCMSKKA